MSDTTTVSITINGVDHEVEAGQRLITAAEKVGEYIPRFCHHDKLEPVGKCRMCLVEVEGPRGKQLVPSCTMIVNDGMVVDTESEVVEKAQEGVLEFLLINHPLDCPICDKGGECPLQDQTMAYGPGESRFIEPKRTYEKPIPISDVVLLDRERCVLCDRCVRVADDIAGDPLITFNDRGNHVQILTFPNEPFSSYFSGNTVQVCPVGALTSVDYRFRARPWDLEVTPTVAAHDTVQSTAEIHTSRGKIVRVYAAENDHLNDGWLSDRDRFSFAANHAPDRIVSPKRRVDGSFEDVSWPEALNTIAERLGGIAPERVGAIGGAHNTNEEAYALGKFLREVVGTNNIDAQLGDGFNAQLAAAVTPRATVDDVESAGAILVWGPDLKETLPVLYLKVRKAVKNGATLVVASPWRTGLDSIATSVVRYRAGSGQEVLRKLAQGSAHEDAAAALTTGPVVTLFGRASLSEDPRLAESVAAYGRTLPDARLMPLLTRSNVFGALDMGLAPDLLPGRVGIEAGSAGLDAMGMLGAAAEGALDVLFLVGSDPVRDCPDPALAAKALDQADFVVAIDAFVTDSSAHADVILPAALWGEVDGTMTNLEGRVQTVSAAFPPRGQAQSLLEIVRDLAAIMGSGDILPKDTDTASSSLANEAPAYAGVSRESIFFESDGTGVVVPTGAGTQPLGYIPTDAAVPVVTDRFTLHFAPSLYDDGVITRHAESIAGLVPDVTVRISPRDASVLAVSDGASVVIDDFLTLPVTIDADVAQGSVVVPFNQVATKGLIAASAVSVEPVRGDV